MIRNLSLAYTKIQHCVKNKLKIKLCILNLETEEVFSLHYVKIPSNHYLFAQI